MEKAEETKEASQETGRGQKYHQPEVQRISEKSAARRRVTGKTLQHRQFRNIWRFPKKVRESPPVGRLDGVDGGAAITWGSDVWGHSGTENSTLCTPDVVFKLSSFNATLHLCFSLMSLSSSLRKRPPTHPAWNQRWRDCFFRTSITMIGSQHAGFKKSRYVLSSMHQTRLKKVSGARAKSILTAD